MVSVQYESHDKFAILSWFARLSGHCRQLQRSPSRAIRDPFAGEQLDIQVVIKDPDEHGASLVDRAVRRPDVGEISCIYSACAK